MERNLKEELEHLRTGYATAHPAARLRIAHQRLARAASEPGSTRLVTVVAAVESLARSLVVHAPRRPSATAEIRYRQVRDAGPSELIAEVLRLHGSPGVADCFGADTWEHFELAHQYRDLVVHEGSAIGPDRTAALIAAAERVFERLVELTGLPRVVS